MVVFGMDDYQGICKDNFAEWFNKSKYAFRGPDDILHIDTSEVFVVWSCKTLQNYKCIVGTRYAPVTTEYTYNGATKELYEEIYDKISNKCYS